MGIRQIRFCDITGTENDVESHEIHIDQMRIAIDLAGSEYRRLIEAGRMEASVPDAGSLPYPESAPRKPRKRASTSTGLTAAERDQLRQWAEARDVPVPVNHRFKQSLIDQWRADATSGRREQVTDEPVAPGPPSTA
ncbi:Lsr2 family protein [Pseudonocardia parietis]|uniref:Lsr2 protein n=1 Tax=Pseudonocardia parietis TaxID=570936 RepID=A0ABS4W7V3_9PSEU|nr:Lsr2 family protein [Pseudonocardia parietis]MBP2371724.1 hypothetical protein [Pseudonocardia parietis]